MMWPWLVMKTRLDLIKDSARLSLRHTYMPKVPVDFAGPSYFGGKNDQLVLCVGKAGGIHVWDRESTTLLHHIHAQALGSDLTCITWNHAVEPFMFATGSHDGAVRIWTTPKHHIAHLRPPSISSEPPSQVAATPITSKNITPRPSEPPHTETPLTQQGFDLEDKSTQDGLQNEQRLPGKESLLG